MAGQPKKRVLKRSETVRERADKVQNTAPKKRRLRSTATNATRPVRALAGLGRKEFYLPLPTDTFLNKRRSPAPSYFKEAWQELRAVNWPGRKETWKLTFAVFIFAIVFGLLIAVTDYGLDKVFKKLILKS
jgi:preprotein translocase SecE subunit